MVLTIVTHPKIKHINDFLTIYANINPAWNKNAQC
jgi:hypothetical protein